jgi:hypothetical protein
LNQEGIPGIIQNRTQGLFRQGMWRIKGRNHDVSEKYPRDAPGKNPGMNQEKIPRMNQNRI